MAKSKSKGPARLMFALVLVSAGVVGSLAYYVNEKPEEQAPAGQERSGGGFFREAHASEPQKARDALVVRPVFKGDELSFVKAKRSVPVGMDAKAFVINEFLNTSKIAPEGTRLLVVEQDGELAKLFFNEKLQQGGFGSTDEKTFLDGLAASLGQFRGIEKFELYADGVLVEELGHADLSEPLPVSHAPH